MAAQHPPLAALWVAVLLALPTAYSFDCSSCSKHFKSHYCIDPPPTEQTYTLEITNSKNGEESKLFYRCHFTAQYMPFTFHKGCNFSTVQYVSFQDCPLPNVTFSEVLTQLGIIPENVVGLSFQNFGARKDLKLETWHLDGLTNLDILELSRNPFTSLPPDMLRGTPNLGIFLLSHTRMPSPPATLFAHTPNISTINFLYNTFESIPDNIFDSIPKLVILRLFGNTLGEFNPKLLANIPNVYKLELSRNQITKLTSETFKHLPKLRYLYLKSNHLETLPEDIFHNSPKLEAVHLHKNRLSSFSSELFRKSKNLSDFNFQDNKVTNIPQTLFQGLHNLTNLAMQGNSLESIPDGAFKDLVKLEKVSLHNNPLKTLPSGTFDHQRKLKKLTLANTSLVDLPDDLFKNCESLQEIDLSDNHLSKLKSNVFPHPGTVLQSLKLGKNNLSFSEVTSMPQAHEILVEQFPFSDQVNITHLYLNNNRIQVIPHALRNLNNLKYLNLKNNSIKYVDYYDFLFSSDYTTVDPRDASRANLQLPYPLSKQVVDVELGDNPLICDCNLYKFAQLLQNKISEEEEEQIQLQVVDRFEVKCTLPNDASVQQLVVTLDISTLVCYRKECHPSCTCATRPHDRMFVVDCAHQTLHALPALNTYLPKEDYSLTLNLNNNSIGSLEGLQNSEYSNLVNLTMPYNHLKCINESYLPKKLQVLDLSGNALTYFSPSLIDLLNVTNPSLGLGGNPWLCDCQLVDLYTFLRDPLRKMANSHSIMCDNLKQPLLSLTEEQLCPTIQQPMVVVTIASTTVFLFLFFVLGTVSVYKYQQNIKVWLFSHQMCLWVVAKEEADTKKYDAFISYSNKDEEYVNTVLVPGLENGEPRYRVCLHYRDWMPGEYIHNQIDQSIEDSHRTIVILSSNFIENVWGQIEFKTAHSKALKEKSKKIIVIVLGQVPPESEMDEELKLYLSTRTYLQSDHPRFWENLRYAMPHPQEFLLKKRTKTKKTENLQMVQTDGKPRS